MKQAYQFKVRNETSPPIEAVVLAHDGGGDIERKMEAWIVPGYGSNLCRFSVGGNNIIDFDPQLLLKHDYTGTPVLYPTPNRVRNGLFRWRDRSYRQTKRGTLVVEHGLVHGENWKYSDPVVETDSAILRTWIEFRKGNPAFEAFPFTHRLTLEFRLSSRELAVTYAIENQGNEEVPFGFGLHPYFMKLSGDERTFVTLPADSVMDYTSDLLPTGRLIDVKGSLEASEDFSHAVLYSPRGEDFFCLETQTCSTDAHNLFDRGFTHESGLKTVSPGKTHQGFVTYSITF
jgi:aldose 1-epimerase